MKRVRITVETSLGDAEDTDYFANAVRRTVVAFSSRNEVVAVDTVLNVEVLSEPSAPVDPDERPEDVHLSIGDAAAARFRRYMVRTGKASA